MNEATGNSPASYAFVSLWYAFDAFETSSELNQTWHISIMYFNFILVIEK